MLELCVCVCTMSVCLPVNFQIFFFVSQEEYLLILKDPNVLFFQLSFCFKCSLN